jgi:IS5 family transposase
MPRLVTVQASIFDLFLFAEHEIGRELKAMSQRLDKRRELIGLASKDLCRHGVKETWQKGAGRVGRALTAL